PLLRSPRSTVFPYTTLFRSGRNPGVRPAEVELPGYRPARLGQRADPLCRAANRPGRAASIHCVAAPPRRVPRTLRREDVLRHLAHLQATNFICIRTLYATRRLGYQPL